MSSIKKMFMPGEKVDLDSLKPGQEVTRVSFNLNDQIIFEMMDLTLTTLHAKYPNSTEEEVISHAAMLFALISKGIEMSDAAAFDLVKKARGLIGMMVEATGKTTEELMGDAERKAKKERDAVR